MALVLALAVVVLGNMAKLVQNHIVDASCGVFIVNTALVVTFYDRKVSSKLVVSYGV